MTALDRHLSACATETALEDAEAFARDIANAIRNMPKNFSRGAGGLCCGDARKSSGQRVADKAMGQ